MAVDTGPTILYATDGVSRREVNIDRSWNVDQP